MSYYISTFCHGNKFTPICDKWKQRIAIKCPTAEIIVFSDVINTLKKSNFDQNYRGFIWAIRFKQTFDFILSIDKPLIMCDLDVIVEKDLTKLVDLPYDIIISKEIGENKAYPQECSAKLGFGVCCGFSIFKPSSKKFLFTIYQNMIIKKYGTYDDQVNFMKYIVDHHDSINEEEVILDNVTYTNKIICIDNIKICVLDFNIVIRDPITNKNQFANHINIDNVGGTQQFLKYFDEKLENLPLTCRCGKTHLGDNNICKHIELRKQKSV